ncbi:type II toxin-antitoxin system VapC family toxin [Phytoactinopolyspora endophytica]|uniref:type II toxin-antitoxin system VapC family toxin n=1 Tax=Phytoactinopolyspora endophytica TaxID=1642495 RepID=UPI00101E1938|nr:type II toxin-antitoxin system VapC family toxin [Phytoactinopolyspora endophytica]
MIVDASTVIDAVADAGPRGDAARQALADHPASERLLAPGHFAFELMSGLRAAANRPGHPFQPGDIEQALLDAESLEITIEGTPWADVHRAWALSQASLRYADAVYVACAERHRVALLTSDERIERSGAPLRCEVVTVRPDES